MVFVKKLPWVSLLLLLFTYGVFGWLLSTDAERLANVDARKLTSTTLTLGNTAWLLWLMGAIYSFLIAFALAAPLTLIRNFYTGWLQSDTRAFFSVIFGAFFAVIILSWLEVVVRILVLLAAGALVRLDLQTADYGEWQAFGIISAVSLGGFSLGVIMHQLI
ncbi:MAG: hypothetical protein KME25_02175 [Symplocastrum torsivum CPER-KK1]|jgi:hypothetical protein|uniref:Uncharacterized protein n=1 Tax=Symplocastrum torsivum CPER-KK1 TaxID=450513 RepID=A0A951PG63_9CYAN|nr:hypothetical protein [Symplocastrum torsivum CPER-KK1]